MSAHDSSLAIASAPLPYPHRKTSFARAAALPLAVVVAVGAACVWATARVTTVDRPYVAATGGAAAVALGLAVALAMSRHRATRELRVRTELLRAEAARTVTAYADAARRAAIELEAAQRAVREADVRRRTAAEAEVSLRAALKAETARAAALEGETARLAEVTVPLAVERLRSGGSADTVLSRLPQPTGPAHQRLLDVLIREIGASERMRAAGMTACASAAGRLQALTTGMLADLRAMEHRHGEDVLGDLLHLDHCTAQAGRLADNVAVLTGARTGRRWTKPIVMESVLRGAMGRIDAYQRVRLHSASTAAVAGHAAEGVMHALAELMDNACNFSPPTEEVHVYVQETHSGVVVTIEDAGLVMPDATLARAEKLVSGDPLDLRALSGSRLGLAVVGCLARKHGLLVSFRPSARGGTGVIVLIPAKIVTQTPDGYPVPAHHLAEPAREPAPAHARPAVPLPKRSRGQTLAAHQGDLTADPAEAWPEPSPEDEERQEREARTRAGAGSRFSAFREAAAGRSPGGRPERTGERTGGRAEGGADGRTDGLTDERAADRGDAHTDAGTGGRTRGRAGERMPGDFTATGEGPTAGPIPGEAWGAGGAEGTDTVPTGGDTGI